MRDRAERWNNGGVDDTHALCRLASDWQWSAGRHPRPPHLSTRISNRYRYHHRGGSSLPGTVQASPAPWLRPSTCPPPRAHSSALAVPVSHSSSIVLTCQWISVGLLRWHYSWWWDTELDDAGWRLSPTACFERSFQVLCSTSTGLIRIMKVKTNHSREPLPL